LVVFESNTYMGISRTYMPHIHTIYIYNVSNSVIVKGRDDFLEAFFDLFTGECYGHLLQIRKHGQ
jgi:hypothetical protein